MSGMNLLLSKFLYFLHEGLGLIEQGCRLIEGIKMFTKKISVLICSFIALFGMETTNRKDEKLSTSADSDFSASGFDSDGRMKVIIANTHGNFLQERIEFFTAARDGDLEIIQEFLHMPKFTVNTLDRFQRTALIIAAHEGHVAVVKELISSQRIDINEDDGERKTALIWATLKGNIDVIRELLMIAEININAQDEKGKTALHYAVAQGNKQSTSLLLDHGADPNVVDLLERKPKSYTKKRNLKKLLKKADKSRKK